MELTGWAIDGGVPWGRKRGCQLAYSDHPGFDELVQYVAQVQPKQVYTVNGFPETGRSPAEAGLPGPPP